MGSDQITASIVSEDVSVSEEDVESLSQNRMIDSIAPVISSNQNVKKNSNSGSFSIIGVTEEYFNVQGADIQRGRPINSADIEYTTNVAIIGTDVATELFDAWDAVNGIITIDGKFYTVIGVLEEQGISLVGSDNNRILIPLTTAAKLTGSDSISSFYVKTTSILWIVFQVQ